MDERAGFENQYARKGIGGSNPPASAISSFYRATRESRESLKHIKPPIDSFALNLPRYFYKVVSLPNTALTSIS